MWHGFFCCLKISPHGRQILWQHGWMIALTSLSMQTLQVMSYWLGVGSACSSAAWVDSSSTSPLTSSISLSLSESTSPVSLNLLVCRLAMAEISSLNKFSWPLNLFHHCNITDLNSINDKSELISTELNLTHWTRFEKWQIRTYLSNLPWSYFENCSIWTYLLHVRLSYFEISSFWTYFTELV